MNPSKVKRRTTKRKSIIECILADEYGGGPVLLEELRWNVLRRQYGPSFIEMSDAKQKSFARTIREHCPQFMLEKTRMPEAPVGLIVRAGLYRSRSYETIERFLNANQQHIFVNIGFPDHAGYLRGEYGMRIYNEKRQRYRKRLPQITIGCFFLDAELRGSPWPGALNDAAMARTVLPKSHRLVLVQRLNSPRAESFPSLANVPWTIRYFNDSLEGGGAYSMTEMDPLDPLPFRWKRS